MDSDARTRGSAMSQVLSQNLSSTLKWWHIAACVVHLSSFAILSTLRSTPDTFPKSVGPYTYGYACVNATSCQVSQSLASSYITSTPRQGVLANELLTAVSHAVGVAIAWQPEGKRSLESWRRWTEYATTAGVLECAILYGYGVRDFFVFVLVFALNAALQYTGGLSLDQIQDSDDAGLYATQKPILLVQSFLFLFVQVWFTLTTATNSDIETVHSDIVASSILYAIFYASFGVLQTLKHTVSSFEKRYNVDIGFIVLSVTSKLCLSYHAVSIQKQIEQTLGDTSDVLSEEIETLRAAVIVLYVVSAVAILAYALWPRLCRSRADYDDL